MKPRKITDEEREHIERTYGVECRVRSVYVCRPGESVDDIFDPVPWREQAKKEFAAKQRARSIKGGLRQQIAARAYQMSRKDV